VIVEIEKPRLSSGPSLDYNEGKVLEGVAELVGYANMESVAREDIYELFQRYEKSVRYATRERSFHASVNPSAEDKCNQEQILSFIKGLMANLGYGSQPYLVYRHFDIEREHYHIVSTRIDKDGYKINNYFEKRRTSTFMREHAHEFGFSVPKKGDRVHISQDLAESSGKDYVPRLDLRKGRYAQLRDIYAHALGYDFNSIAQLQCILEDLGVRASCSVSDGRPQISLQGLDRSGVQATEVLSESSLGMPLHAQAMMVIQGNDSHRLRLREKERVKSLVGYAFGVSRSEGHFVNILSRKGIKVHFSRTADSGDVFGVTFVDHTTKSVFKASEIRGVFTVKKMQEAVSTGKWRVEDRGYARNSFVRGKRVCSQEAALAERDIHVGAVARSLTPVGQPRGASWSGQGGESDEERKAKKEAGKTGALYADLGHNKLQDVIM